MRTQQNELMTKEQLANYLGVSVPTIDNWTRMQLLDPVRKGRRVFYEKQQPKTRETIVNNK